MIHHILDPGDLHRVLQQVIYVESGTVRWYCSL